MTNDEKPLDLFDRMLDSQVKRDKEAVARDAQSLAELAERVARDPDLAMRTGRITELATDAQLLLLLATRLTERDEALKLYRADHQGREGGGAT